jgi:L-alanine-DL-glutamate epimerase-like enolase superfamily enzyme
MRIAALETIPYALPFRDPYVTARGKLAQRELMLARIRTHGGPTGIGETVAMSLRGGPELEAIKLELDEVCAPLLTDVKLTVANLAGVIAGVQAAGVSMPALAAVDLALHDLAAKIEGVPVWSLLGATRAQAVRCNATLVAGDPTAVATDAERWVQDGFATLKLKAGVADDVAQVRAVRERVPPGTRIRVDANGAWSPPEAVERLNAMATQDIELAEQPTADLEGMAQVRHSIRIPVVADESVAGAEDARRAVEAGACDMATVKLAKVGGIAAAIEIALHIPTYLSSALDGPIGIAAAWHLAQYLPQAPPARGLDQGLATQRLFADTIAARGPGLDGPLLSVDDEPGFGVEIDELALARHRLDR